MARTQWLAACPATTISPAGAKAGQRLVRVTVAAPGDKLAANDTLFATLDVAAGAAAVFASTTPDFDARYALDVLRGTLAVPTRGFYRVAPGQWRVDGTLAAIPEDEVKKNLAEAPIVVIHGDTAVFGAPRGYAKGALALVAPPVAKGVKGKVQNEFTVNAPTDVVTYAGMRGGVMHAPAPQVAHHEGGRAPASETLHGQGRHLRSLLVFDRRDDGSSRLQTANAIEHTQGRHCLQAGPLVRLVVPQAGPRL